MVFKLPDYLLVQEPMVLAVALGIAAFAITLVILSRIMGNRGLSTVISLCIGIIVWYSLLRNRFYGYESVLTLLLYAFIVIFLLRIFWNFVRGIRYRTGTRRDRVLHRRAMRRRRRR